MPEDYVTDALKSHLKNVVSDLSGIHPDTISVNHFPPAELCIPAHLLGRTIRCALQEMAESGQIRKAEKGGYSKVRP